jgi:protein-tyrosine phosphatase
MTLLSRVLFIPRRAQLTRRLAAIAPVRSVLVMCTANLVRSPFAAGYLMPRLPHLDIRSRGILLGGGSCPSDAVTTAAQHGVVLDRHRSRTLEATEMLSAGLILMMEARMQQQFTTQFPALTNRCLLLGTCDPAEEGDIADPFGLGLDEYRDAYARIRRCCDTLVALLSR